MIQKITMKFKFDPRFSESDHFTQWCLLIPNLSLPDCPVNRDGASHSYQPYLLNKSPLPTTTEPRKKPGPAFHEILVA